jgi:hypothetical protein
MEKTGAEKPLAINDRTNSHNPVLFSPAAMDFFIPGFQLHGMQPLGQRTT